MESKYQLLKIDFLREFILGKYMPGSFFPSERDVAANYGISRMVVRRMVQELQHGGYLKRINNGRNVVCSPPETRASKKLLLVQRKPIATLPDIHKMLYEALVQKCSCLGILLFVCDEKRLAQVIKKDQHFDAAVSFGFDLLQLHKRIPADRFFVLDEIENSLSHCITTDNYVGGKMAAQHLFRCGCRRPVFIGLDYPQGGYLFWTRRERGFMDYMKKHKVATSSLYIPNSTPKACLSALMSYPQLEETDGFFVIHDYLAINVLHALARLNISVPEQISVVGFDGLACGEYLLPSLTTIAQPVNAIADKLLQTAFSAPKEEGNSLLAPRLIQRSSAVSRKQANHQE